MSRRNAAAAAASEALAAMQAEVKLLEAKLVRLRYDADELVSHLDDLFQQPPFAERAEPKPDQPASE
jgi:hypothetical protein